MSEKCCILIILVAICTLINILECFQYLGRLCFRILHHFHAFCDRVIKFFINLGIRASVCRQIKLFLKCIQLCMDQFKTCLHIIGIFNEFLSILICCIFTDNFLTINGTFCKGICSFKSVKRIKNGVRSFNSPLLSCGSLMLRILHLLVLMLNIFLRTVIGLLFLNLVLLRFLLLVDLTELKDILLHLLIFVRGFNISRINSFGIKSIIKSLDIIRKRKLFDRIKLYVLSCLNFSPDLFMFFTRKIHHGC